MNLNSCKPIFIVLLFCVLLQKSFAQSNSHPNLVFIFPDQMRGQAMGFVGEEKVLTPHLDHFATESVYFTQAVSNYPVCSPTRAMIMTGQYPLKNKVIGNCTSRTALYNCELPENIRCWSDILHDNGYSLGYIGKWHLDSPYAPYIPTSNNSGETKWNEWCPPSRRHGFDYWHAYGTYDYHLKPMYWDTNASRDSFKYYNEWGPEHEANRAIDYIQNKDGKFRNENQSFALVISMNPPHTAYKLVPDKYKKLYEKIPIEELTDKPNIPAFETRWGKHYRESIKDYYACISGVDEQFGRILQALDSKGLAENTIVVFTSDHGDCMGIHGEVTKNNPYEESMRVPLLIRFPEKLKSGNNDMLISTTDLYPTLLGLMGFDAQIPDEVDGINYADYLITGKGKKPDSQWYMKIDSADISSGLRGIRTERYTYVIRQEKDDNKVLLFDRQKDPYQENNLAGKFPKLEKQLQNQLRESLLKNNDPWIKHLKP